jgi:hypothetical protein
MGNGGVSHFAALSKRSELVSENVSTRSLHEKFREGGGLEGGGEEFS